MKPFPAIVTVVLLLLISCSSKQSIDISDKEVYNQLREKGNFIASQTQSVLLSNVSNAMQKGGSHYAVEFCNLRASGITDSLSMVHQCTISRVTDKRRNPANKLTLDAEKQLWEYYHEDSNQQTLHDTVLTAGQRIIYYKPITIAMAACLQCHGNVDDINPETHSTILELYPDDEATGYALNELRGMWKIEFIQ